MRSMTDMLKYHGKPNSIIRQVQEITTIECPSGEHALVDATINDHGEIHIMITDTQSGKKIALMMYGHTFNKILNEVNDLAHTYIIE